MMDRPSVHGARPAASDLVAAAVLGVGIALSLSALTLVAMAEDVGRLPMPVAVAAAAHVFGKQTLGMRGLLLVGLAAHVSYLTVVTAAAVAVVRGRLTARAALVTAAALWVVAGVTVLPYVGWAVFGSALGGGAVLQVIALHLLYGVFLWAGSWAAFGRTAGAGGTTFTVPADAIQPAGVSR